MKLTLELKFYFNTKIYFLVSNYINDYTIVHEKMISAKNYKIVTILLVEFL